MASMITQTCKNSRCRKHFTAREADVKRGWGLYCSKSCKATVQTAGRAGRAPARRTPLIVTAKGASDNGYYQSWNAPLDVAHPPFRRNLDREAHEEGMDAMEDGWDGHK